MTEQVAKRPEWERYKKTRKAQSGKSLEHWISFWPSLLTRAPLPLSPFGPFFFFKTVSESMLLACGIGAWDWKGWSYGGVKPFFLSPQILCCSRALEIKWLKGEIVAAATETVAGCYTGCNMISVFPCEYYLWKLDSKFGVTLPLPLLQHRQEVEHWPKKKKNTLLNYDWHIKSGLITTLLSLVRIYWEISKGIFPRLLFCVSTMGNGLLTELHI